MQARLEAAGVDPAAVDARLAKLTRSELGQMTEPMEQMPAGGDVLALVGAAFIELLILEVIGAIRGSIASTLSS